MIFREIFDRNWYTKRNKVYAPIHPDDRYDYKLMQYTGLKDRNGQEVFEGDVIKMIALHNDHHQKGAVDYASIYFSHGQFCIALDGYKIGTPLFNVKLSSSVEVIGNIHENPELLK
jgi:uncharacterized phage protein (TIGR01671 family)